MFSPPLLLLSGKRRSCVFEPETESESSNFLLYRELQSAHTWQIRSARGSFEEVRDQITTAFKPMYPASTTESMLRTATD